MSRTSRPFFVLVAFVAALALGEGARAADAPAASPPLPSTLEEKVEVVLRLVDFLAVDGDGRPIEDLEPAEVRLWEDGEEQKLVDLIPADATPGEPTVGTTPAPQPPPAAPAKEATTAPNAGIAAATAPMAVAAPRWIILFLDARNLSYQNLARAGAAVKDLVAHNLGPEDRVALMVDEDDLAIVVPFTTQRTALLQYLEHPEGLVHRSRDMERRLKELQENSQSCRDTSEVVKCVRDSTGSFLLETSRETETSLNHLEALLRGLSAIPHRKILLYVSDGFLLDPGDVALAAVEHAIGQNNYSTSAMRGFLQRDYRSRIDRIYQLATESRTGFYPVNASRRMSDDAFAPEERTDYGPDNLPQARSDLFEANWQQVSSLARSLASATGGTPVIRRDPAGLLAGQIASSSGVYTVAYHPPNAYSVRHKIKIKVSRRKAQVFYRATLRPLPERMLPLAGELVATTDKDDPASGLVSVRLSVGGAGFVVAPESEPPVSVAALFIEIRDAARRLVKDLHEMIAFPRGEKGKITIGMLERPFALKVPPGAYTLRVDVRDVNGPASGSFFTTFAVESPGPSLSAGPGGASLPERDGDKKGAVPGGTGGG